MIYSDSRHWITDVKFAPNGKSFAVGSMDHKIYLYNSETFRLKGTCDRHNSNVKEINYSQDSMYIQSDSSDNEHLYFEAEDGEFFSAGSQLRDIKWADWTCIYGWPLQGSNNEHILINFINNCIIFNIPSLVTGAWPYFDDVEKGIAFEPTSAHRSPNQSLLVIGDKSGAVKIYNYPCLSKQVKKCL